jgi:hypothetical protein
VSHAPERKEKDCLNCGATVMGRFCHICGQENTVPKESFGKLVLHFFYDITHFDGKFFESLKYLLFRPGFLSKEYVRGRRASYLNPVRMYVFTSAIFFLIFFMVVDPKSLVNVNDDKLYTKNTRLAMITKLEKEYKKPEADTSVLLKQIALLKDTSRPASLSILKKIEREDTTVKRPKTFAQYDSIQKTLAPSKRDGWLKRMAAQKIEYNKELQNNPSGTLEQWAEVFLHRLPYLLFISLPVFALILKLLYLRRRKEFYYADHAIFSIHHYILSFILLLFCFLFGTIYDLTGFGIFRTILLIVLFGIWPIHLYIAMFNFYKQKWFKTFIKFLFLNLLGFLTVMILFGIFLLISLIQL